MLCVQGHSVQPLPNAFGFLLLLFVIDSAVLRLLCAVFGLACHIGVQLDLPSVGIAKTLYHVDGIEKNEDHLQKVCSFAVFYANL